MSEYAASPGTGASRWRSHHLGAANSAVLVSGQTAGPGPYGRFERKDEVTESVYRPGPLRSDYENPTEDLGGLDQPEPYRSTDFRGSVYNSNDYSKWSISAGAPRSGSISPKGPLSHSSGDSLTESPLSRPGHTIVVHSEDSEAMGINTADFDDDSEAHLSSDERRAEKRKMKRFRLTHNQTRFLMSEFARQPHPDAAHRERLAQEIPGLSPRQVQVWFQNRRAKLKRMSSEDRERMMRSRAVPEDFNIAQTLQSSYGRISSGSAPIYSPTSIGGNPVRSLTLDSLSPRTDEDALSPYFSTPPASNSDILSPMSYTGDRTFAGYQSTGPYSSPSRTSNPFRPNGAPELLNRSNTMPRLQLHDNKSRTPPEPLPAPLKSNTTYAPLEYGDYQLGAGGQSLHGIQYIEPPRSYSSSYLPGYSSMKFYTYEDADNYAQAYPSPASTQARSSLSGLPPIDLPPGYKQDQNQVALETRQMSGFQSDYQLPQLAAPPDTNSFNSSYQSRSTSDASQAAGQLTPLSMVGSSQGRSESDDITAQSSQHRTEFGHSRSESNSHPPAFAPPQ
ncbi:hypothetical protein FGG08_003397 [Glutinoglossum americanum]|uniref:Homeobox domain-containing protein n=1 Tax=Glutinoglossum americanum TaxID=1670608 RepID=A0A9P8I7R1_9PEZI|nr:hypothetical protein FGG08_003397 [Glutinoglossum americanum]